MELYDELNSQGALVRAAFALSPYQELPQGHTWVPHDETLMATKAARKSSIETWRDDACLTPVIVAVDGVEHAWDADKRSQDLLGTSVSLASLGIVPAPEVWRSADNDNVLVTLEDLKNIVATIAMQTQVAYGHSWLLKAYVDAATTQAAVEAVVW